MPAVGDALASLRAVAARPASFEELCRAGLPALRRLAGFDGVCVLALDPETLLPSAGFDDHGIPLDRAARLVELEYGGEEAASLADLHATGTPAVDLHGATGGRPWLARRWAEVLEPSDRPYEARVLLAAGGEAWGGLVLFRDGGGRAFSAEELAALRAAAPVLATGVRLGVLAAAARAGGADAPGVLLADAAGRVRSASATGARWLEELEDLHGRAFPMRLRALVGRALHDRSAPARATLGTRAGAWVTLHADVLEAPEGEAEVAVVVEPARQERLVPLLARAHGLTPRERDVLGLVLRGTSTKAMARALGLSAWTVQDHLKAIFEKTGTRTRGEVAALLLGTGA